jgi:hypothetical protein
MNRLRSSWRNIVSSTALGPLVSNQNGRAASDLKVNKKLPTGERIWDDAILSHAKMFLAFKRLKKLYGVDIFANKCLPEMTTSKFGYEYATCVATCPLNKDDVMTACEADVPAALSIYILSLLSGEKVFFADIARLNKEHKRLTFFNCGTGPLSMADRNRDISLWPIPAMMSNEAVPDEYFLSVRPSIPLATSQGYEPLTPQSIQIGSSGRSGRRCPEGSYARRWREAGRRPSGSVVPCNASRNQGKRAARSCSTCPRTSTRSRA